MRRKMIQSHSSNRATEQRTINALSVDVEDYFQVAAFDDVIDRHDWDRFESRVEKNSRGLMELFAEHDVEATFFILGWIAERCPSLVREIRDGGHEVACHGYDHRRVTSQTPEEFRADVRLSKKILEDITGAEVLGYRAPTYSVVSDTLWALDVLLEEGFLYDSSIFPIRHDRYGIPDAQRFPSIVRENGDSALWEFPISTLRLAGLKIPFVGGGYTRHFPRAFVHWCMRRLNSVEGQAAVVYIHPWEIDPEQPRQPAPMLTRIRHYRNLGKTRERLAALLREFRFTTMRRVLEL